MVMQHEIDEMRVAGGVEEQRTGYTRQEENLNAAKKNKEGTKAENGNEESVTGEQVNKREPATRCSALPVA